MKGVKYIAFVTILACLLIAIPAGFAADDADNTTLSVSHDDTLGDEYYFDCNNVNDGNGSLENPYKELTQDRVKANSVIHLANGEYNISQDQYYSGISINGEDAQNTILNGNGHILHCSNSVSFKNITLKNLKIVNDNVLSLSASNTIFKDCIDDEGKGGAIYASKIASMSFTNCTFYNNSASYGGAIYLSSGSLEIHNSSFENNSAIYGGAIYTTEAFLRVYNSTFKNNEAIMLGGAVTSIKSSKMEFGNSTFANNVAGFEGGAIYSLKDDSLIYGSLFDNNVACAGGALLIYTNSKTNVSSNRFINNSADAGGAVYSLSNDDAIFLNNAYVNNSAVNTNDLLETDISYLFIGNGNVTLYQYSSNYTGELPSYYNLKDDGFVTPIRDQGSGGNCWAFSALGALESCLLKASGISYDLSEDNMKNMMADTSEYGWTMAVNGGGYIKMAIGYLTSWLGPILESDDAYDAKSTFSLIYNSLTHIQNIVFLTRTDYTDNDIIKKAILDYGAVSTAIKWKGYSYKGNARYYNGNGGADHAVIIVGWDDNYSRDNFAITPPGDGAWIIKNSHGAASGDKGYWYVSYYDVRVAEPNKSGATYTFVLNESIKYDKNYQYDIPGMTDVFLNSSSTAWYKNVFNSTDYENLSAVSTYFNKDTNWTLIINVNGEMKLNQSGFSKEGYWTINLNEFIPLNVGDIFEVVFKITVDGDAGVPISEQYKTDEYGNWIDEFVSKFFKENVSFLSYDGENWMDFYNLAWTYPNHKYNSQVACIKAFTILNQIDTTLKLSVEDVDGYYFNVLASVYNQWGGPVNNGFVTFNISNSIYEANVIDGLANLSNIFFNSGIYNISAQFGAVGFISSNDSIKSEIPQQNTTLKLIYSGCHNPVNITAVVTYSDGESVNYGNVTFTIDGEDYTIDVVNGIANIVHIFKNEGFKNISAKYNGIYNFNPSKNNASFNFSFIKTHIEFNLSSNNHNPVDIIAYVYDEYNNLINMGNVTFEWDGQNVTVGVVNGTAGFSNIFTSTGLHNVSASYLANYIYNSSADKAEINIYKISIDLQLSIIKNLNDVVVIVNTSIPIDENVSISLNGQNYSAKVNDSMAIFSFDDLPKGDYLVKAFINSYVYCADEISDNFTVYNFNTHLSADKNQFYYGKNTYNVTLRDGDGNPISDKAITVTVGQKAYTQMSDDLGTASFVIDLDFSDNRINICYEGDENYTKANLDASIMVYSTIVAYDSTKTLNSKYEVRLLDSSGNPLKNADVNLLVGSTAYKLRTDGNGIARLNIDLNPGNYQIRITNPVNGETKTQNIRVVSRIAENNGFTMYYGAGKSYTVRVFDDNGNAAGGVEVRFTLNGIAYSRITDGAGYASFKITSKPGVYTITAEYKGFSVSNKITVKSTIVTKNIKVKKGKTIKFTAKLLNKNGKILKGKKVTFKFKGKTYKVKTNKKGKATLKIAKRYKAGKYTITTSYGKLKVKNTIRIK